MKRLLLIAAFALVANVASAQEAAKADVQKMMQLSGANTQADMIKKQVTNIIPAEKKEEFIKEFDAIIKPIKDKQEKFYLTEFTADEIKQLIKFYESPLGKKFREKSVKLSEENSADGQEIMTSLNDLVMKYMQ